MATILTNDKHYTNIAEEIRRHVPSIGSLAPAEMPNAIQAACEAEFALGEQQYNDFWNTYLDDYDTGNYTYRFSGFGWNDTTFFPNQDIVPTKDCFGMFYNSKITNLTQRLLDCGVTLDFSQCNARVDMMFCYSALEDIPFLDFSQAKRSPDNNNLFNSMFVSCKNLRIIRGMRISDDGTAQFKQSFDYCTNLEEIYFYGTIGKNGLDLHYSNKLTHDSLMSVINCLADYSQDTSGTSWVVTLGATNLAKLTDAEKAIATQKGWTLA